MRCQGCGFELATNAKFCSECGEPVARPDGPAQSRPSGPESGPSTLDGERRQLTVLFTDLVGSTAIASRLDPEDWREVVSAYQEACSGVVERFGGYVAQYLGDGLVVYFGYPTAHEDDALRAVRTGLGVIEAIALLEPRLERFSVKLAVRIGIHTGTVVVGEVGSSARKETLALGDTTNLAARLQEVAAPNTVVMSAATFRLVRGQFVTEEQGVHALKGIAKPVSVYRAMRAIRVKSTFDLATNEVAEDIVGRRGELGILRERWQQAREGRGQVVLLSGEAGIGKSRVAAALRHEIAGHPHTWLESRGSSYMQDTAFYPVVTLQEDALGLGAFEKSEQKVAQLERSLERTGLTVAEHLPLFADLHSLPLPSRHKALALSPEAQRRRTLDSLVEWVIRVSEEQPAVLLLEDLHWVDPTTLEFVGQLVARTAGCKFLLLLTHRPSFSAPWGDATHVTRILLGRLARADAADLISKMEALRGKLPEDLAGEILNRSDGVPLFLEELTKTVLEAEAAHKSGEGARKPTVPSTLQDSLMARLDQLGPAKELVQLCATVGREFSLELLRATASLDETALLTALDRLVTAELLQRRGEPPSYSFRHALLQEQAYESLLKTVRQSYHRKIAEVLATQFPQVRSREPEVLAHHHDAAGLREQALGYWLQAGQKSIARSANVEASRQLLRGLEALGHLPESIERDQQELLLLTMRAVALIAARGYGADEVEQAFARARVLCQKLGDTPHLFPVLFGLCLFYLVRAKPVEANELAAQLETIATATSDPDCILETHSAKAALCFWEGRFSASQEHILRARTMFDPAKHGSHVFVYGQDPLAYGYSYGALALWFLGYPEQALLSARRSLELAERANHPPTLAGVLSFYGDLHHHLRQPALFDDLARRTIAVAMDQNLPMWVGTARTQRGWVRFQLGEREEGIREIVAGLEAFRKTGAEINTAYFISRLVETLLESGRIEEGLERVDEALNILDTSLDRYYEAELHRLKGELLRCASRADAAEACFERALAVSRAQSAKSLELRAAMSLGRLRADTGRVNQAVSLLAEPYEWFTEGLDTPDLLDAKALLSEWRAL
jgi:class 3 adenylate cyclase/predicted ATPase